MPHSHHHHHASDSKLLLAVAINVLLTIAQIIGGIISGSLSLIADALHNLSDAASLGIAIFARKISRKPADELRTFGYKRAEMIAALINLTTLIIIGLYLIYEALWRVAQPQVIAGWLVVIVAFVALVVDVVTVLLTYAQSKNSMNIKAAFLHNVSDALASLAVIVAGSLILLYQWYWVDTLLTLLIAGYVLWQGFSLLPQAIHFLMDGTPEHINIAELIAAMQAVTGVTNVHHLHVWQLDEQHNALEAHVVVTHSDAKALEQLKTQLKALLASEFKIGHATLEFEYARLTSCNKAQLCH